MGISHKYTTTCGVLFTQFSGTKMHLTAWANLMYPGIFFTSFTDGVTEAPLIKNDFAIFFFFLLIKLLWWGKNKLVLLIWHFYRWYHGSITKNEAEESLRNQDEGSYLVRNVDLRRQEFSLIIKWVSTFFLILIIAISFHFDRFFLLLF